jgi:hypothetical protein
MKISDTYNGYANYETWAVALWLGNEEGTYRYWREAAAEAKEEAPRCWQVRERIWPADRAAVFRLAGRIKEDLTEAAPEIEGLYADLLHAALSEVDWHEVAETFLED